uniref:Uncharacterized protein n=1 Tax=Arundo donax TaxID=35708 RepID=A0A0A8YBI2_ARUDO
MILCTCFLDHTPLWPFSAQWIAFKKKHTRSCKCDGTKLAHPCLGSKT